MNVKKGYFDIFQGTLAQIYAVISGSLFAVSCGMTFRWTSSYIPYLTSEKSHIKTSKLEAEWLDTVLLLGSVSGLPITIYLVGKIGKKKSILLASMVATLGWTAIGFANRMEYIFVARYFFGICSNMIFSAAPMYVAEIADQKIRGFLSSIIWIMLWLGCLIVYSVGPFLPFYVSALIGSIIGVLELASFSFVPESPHYLLYKNKPDEAKKSLEYFKPHVDIQKELRDISDIIKEQTKEEGRIQDLVLVNSYRKAIFIVTVLSVGQNLCAMLVIDMNLVLILEAADSTYLDSRIAAILFAAIVLITSCVASFQIDRYGRKVLLSISSVVTGICLLAIAIYFNMQTLQYDVLHISWIVIVSIMMYAAALGLGIGILPITITSEVIPTKLNAIGTATSNVMFMIGGIVAQQIYQWLSSIYGLQVPFYIFSQCSFLITAFALFFLPETKGKSLEEIQQMLKGVDSPKKRSEL